MDPKKFGSNGVLVKDVTIHDGARSDECVRIVGPTALCTLNGTNNTAPPAPFTLNVRNEISRGVIIALVVSSVAVVAVAVFGVSVVCRRKKEQAPSPVHPSTASVPGAAAEMTDVDRRQMMSRSR